MQRVFELFMHGFSVINISFICNLLTAIDFFK